MGGKLQHGNRGHDLTREDRSKGGSVSSERKRIASTFRNRKYCNAKCELYPCLYEPMTRKKENIVKKKKQTFRKCVLKNLPEELQWRVYRILIPTEDNLNIVLTELLVELGKQSYTTGDEKSTSNMIDHAIKVKDAIHGKKIKQEITADVTSKGYSAEDFFRTAQKLYGKKPKKKEENPGDKTEAKISQ